MKLARIAIALAFVACKKDAPKPAEPEHVATDDAPAGGELTCEQVAKNPVIANEPGLAQKFLEYCAEHPEDITQPLLRCAMDAKSLDALDYCEDGEQPDEPEPKPDEAVTNLNAIKKGAKAYYAEHAAWPAGAVPLTPVDPCCDSGMEDRTCPVDEAQWTSADPDRPLVWDELSFAIDEPHYYRYAYERTDTGFIATAVGDLDCDDNVVTYTLEATNGDRGPVFTLTKPARAD